MEEAKTGSHGSLQESKKEQQSKLASEQSASNRSGVASDPKIIPTQGSG